MSSNGKPFLILHCCSTDNSSSPPLTPDIFVVPVKEASVQNIVLSFLQDSHYRVCVWKIYQSMRYTSPEGKYDRTEIINRLYFQPFSHLPSLPRRISAQAVSAPGLPSEEDPALTE